MMYPGAFFFVSELAGFPATTCSRTGMLLSMKKKLNIKCGHSQTEERELATTQNYNANTSQKREFLYQFLLFRC